LRQAFPLDVFKATHHSEQNRNRMGSFLVGPPVSAAGEDMVMGRRRDFENAAVAEAAVSRSRARVCRARETK
jgi:hypothetical protein